MEILAIIPARYGSTRFPGKPLALIGDRPMIRHVYERASLVFRDCFVATDDGRIRQAAESFDAGVILTGGHHRSGTDRCGEALEKVEAVTGKKYDAVINIQGDEPFVEPAHLQALTGLFDDPQTQIGTLVRRFLPGEDVDDPNSVKVVMDRNGFALYFSRAAIPFLRENGSGLGGAPVYYKHIGLYGYRAESLRAVAAMAPGVLEKAESLEQLRWLENGMRIKTAEVEGETLAVDTPQDLMRVNAMLKGR